MVAQSQQITQSGYAKNQSSQSSIIAGRSAAELEGEGTAGGRSAAEMAAAARARYPNQHAMSSCQLYTATAQSALAGVVRSESQPP